MSTRSKTGRLTVGDLIDTEREIMFWHDRAYGIELVRDHQCSVESEHPGPRTRHLLIIVWQEVTGMRDYIRD